MEKFCDICKESFCCENGLKAHEQRIDQKSQKWLLKKFKRSPHEIKNYLLRIKINTELSDFQKHICVSHRSENSS